MRLVTYMGLVARRIWSKRGILVGSMLGATLVTALLAIVSLYEASVQAVDLRFTARGATSDAVDVGVFVPYRDYIPEVAAANSELVRDRADVLLAKWYPERVSAVFARSKHNERSATRYSSYSVWTRLAVGPVWPWYLEPAPADPYGFSAGVESS